MDLLRLVIGGLESVQVYYLVVDEIVSGFECQVEHHSVIALNEQGFLGRHLGVVVG